MRISFKGNYLINFNDGSNRIKMHAYLNRTPAPYKDTTYDPICYKIGDRDLLVITGKEAADFRYLKELVYKGSNLNRNEIHKSLCENFAEIAQRVTL